MTTRNKTRAAWILAVAATVLCGSSITQAEVILFTGFDGRTVSGETADNITWTTSGVQDPGDLTAVEEDADGIDELPGLFDSAGAQGHFAPDLNIGNEGPWSVTIPLTLTAAQIALENVIIDWQHFNNSGIFQGVSRSADWTVSVTGSTSGLLESVTATAVSGSAGIETLTFISPLNLTNAESYEVKIFVAGTNTTGNNTGLDAVTLNGVINTNPDNTAPGIATLSPAGGAMDVSTLANLVITFDEVVRKGTGKIVIRQSSDDAVVDTIDVTSANVTINGAEVTIDPTADLAGLSGFYVEIGPGAIEDISGNAFAGIADNTTWNFTTAAIILATDFEGRIVNGKTAENITWATNGVEDAGDLTWVLEGGGPTTTSLFDTLGAEGHFAPDLNIDNEGPWSTTITLVPTVSQVLLEEVVVGWQHFNNAGAFQSASRAADWVVTVTGSVSGELASVAALNVNGISGVETLAFSPPLALTRAESWEVKIFVTGNGPGNNTGLDAVTLGGKVGPAAAFRFDVANNGANLDLEWESRPGMFYVLRTSTDLEADLATWESVNVPGSFDNNGIFEIASNPPLNMHTIARPVADPIRFYRVEETPLPPVTVLDENFDTTAAETLPAGWTAGFDPADTLRNTSWTLGDPAGGPPSGPSAAWSGTNCVGTNLAANYGVGSITWLRTPAIDLTTATGATVRFQHWVDIDELDNLDRGTVRVLDAGSLTELGVVETNINGINLDFENWDGFSAQLPAAALGQSIVLEFGFVSDAEGTFDASGWYLDDVVVMTPAP